MIPEQPGLKITDQLMIPEEELSFTASRSGGPGGQNVNKVSTRITLWFDVLGSSSLSEGQKQQITQRLPTRINKVGMLWVTAQQTRSQASNKELAKSRLAELLAQALQNPIKRKRTRIPQRVQEHRLESKKKRGRLKRNRSPRISLDS